MRPFGKERVLARLGRVGEIGKERVPRDKSWSWPASGHGKRARLGVPGDRVGATGGEMVPGRVGEIGKRRVHWDKSLSPQVQGGRVPW